MDNHQRINQTSGNTEFWTPKPIIAVASKLMEAIDLDPACSYSAFMYQKHCGNYYEVNGLAYSWSGRVWMNHPFGRDNAKWIEHLVNSHTYGDVTQACCITFASTSEKWFAPLMRYPQFFFTGRTQYIDPVTQKQKVYINPKTGKASPAAPKGSVFTYLFDKENSHYDEAKMRLQEAMIEASLEGMAK